MPDTASATFRAPLATCFAPFTTAPRHAAFDAQALPPAIRTGTIGTSPSGSTYLYGLLFAYAYRLKPWMQFIPQVDSLSQTL